MIAPRAIRGHRDEQRVARLLAVIADRAKGLVGLSCDAFTRRVTLRLRAERALSRGGWESRALLDEAMAGLVEAAGSAVPRRGDDAR